MQSPLLAEGLPLPLSLLSGKYQLAHLSSGLPHTTIPPLSYAHQCDNAGLMGQ